MTNIEQRLRDTASRNALQGDIRAAFCGPGLVDWAFRFTRDLIGDDPVAKNDVRYWDPEKTKQSGGRGLVQVREIGEWEGNFSIAYFTSLYPNLIAQTSPNEWNWVGLPAAVKAALRVRKELKKEALGRADYDRLNREQLSIKAWINSVYRIANLDGSPLQTIGNIREVISHQGRGIMRQLMGDPLAVYCDTDTVYFKASPQYAEEVMMTAGRGLPFVVDPAVRLVVEGRKLASAELADGTWTGPKWFRQIGDRRPR